MNATKTDIAKLNGTERTQEYVDRLTGILEMMKGAPAEQRNPVVEALIGLFL